MSPSRLVNERAWVEFLRLLTYDQVPGPALVAVQALRLALQGRRIKLDDYAP